MKKIVKQAAIFCSTLLASVVLAADYELLFQTSAYKDEKIFELQAQWAKDLEKASAGRLKIELFPNGGVVEYDETLDALGLGLLDGQMTSTSYFAKKNPAFSLIGNLVGAWSNTDDFLKYMYEGGGIAFMNKLYRPHGVKYLGAYTTGVESFLSLKPLDGVADLKGLKIRSPGGLVSDVFAAAGADPIPLSGSKIKKAFERGTIDAADYSVFSRNQEKGFNDIAPNPIYPGFHSMPAFDVSMSQATWDKLPKDIQAMIKSSIKQYAYDLAAYLKAADEKALAEAKKNPNIAIHDWSAEERKKFRAIAQEQWRIISQQSPEAKAVYDSLTTFLKENDLL